ncbi:MAG: putative short chain dehydrogenase/reductase [Pseudonocardiales bacterium]|nr:putative short chain dehydrogenase/reductase [Pseudonocardiales bacterium]
MTESASPAPVVAAEPALAGQVAFITGGAIGFGRAFARALVARGVHVVLADVDVAAAERTASELSTADVRVIALACDVADEAQVDTAVAEIVAELGGIDILINNAGKHLLKYNQPFTVLERSEVRALFDVNVIGVINCSVACRESMSSRGGGAILNITSIAAHLSTSPYGVSKLAVRGLTIAFANEFAPDRIRVNAISPGLMATENAMAELPPAMVDQFISERQLVHRQGEMADVVNAMLFLCSPDSSFVTGETLAVSGGFPLQI